MANFDAFRKKLHSSNAFGQAAFSTPLHDDLMLPPGYAPGGPLEHEPRPRMIPTAPRRSKPRLAYHYGDDIGDWVLHGHDLYPHRSQIQARAKLFIAVAIVTEILMLAWPATALSIWGIEQAFLTFFFAIHLFKAFVLMGEICTYTRVYKLYGRRNFSFLWGIWSRVSHVRDSFFLSTYGVLYGWIHIPLIAFYIILAATSKPLIESDVLYWTQWPLGIVSLLQGYVAWCFIVSEMAIRKQLEMYAPSLRKPKKGVSWDVLE